MAQVEQELTSEEQEVVADQRTPRRPRKLVEIIPSQLNSLRAYHRAVLETQAVEAVHKMRVTTRRLQASLDLLEREMKLRKQKARLRGWRRKLSTVRNYDVFLELIEKEIASRGKARREQLHLIKTILQERREQRSTKVRHFLEHIDIDKIAVRLGVPLVSGSESLETVQSDDESSTNKGDSESHAGTLAVDEQDELAVDAPSVGTMAIDVPKMAGYAAERLEQRFSEFKAMVAQSHPTNDPAELHQLRIAAKRVRYLMEIISEMGYGDASRALVWLRTLQDRIGDWHDLESLEEEIIAIVSSQEFMKVHLAESSQMLQAAAHLQKKKATLVSRLFPVRMPKTIETTSQRLARALRRASLRSEVRAHKPSA